MEPLKQMATLAAEEYLRGRSNKRNSILKPLDIILENLEREHKQDVIRQYVDLFFDGILTKAHEDDINRLLQRSRLIRSAYLVYYRDGLHEEQAKEQFDTAQTEEARQQSMDADE